MDRRNAHVDVLRGILIILVVVGHSKTDILHDIIFLFHMPLFFILSGFLLQKKKLVTKGYLINKSTTLLIPYVIYLLLDFLLVQKANSLKSFLRIIWGGRAISGVYWYITCFLFALVIFAFLLKHFSQKQVKCLILAGGYCGNRISSC